MGAMCKHRLRVLALGGGRFIMKKGVPDYLECTSISTVVTLLVWRSAGALRDALTYVRHVSASVHMLFNCGSERDTCKYNMHVLKSILSE